MGDLFVGSEDRATSGPGSIRIGPSARFWIWVVGSIHWLPLTVIGVMATLATKDRGGLWAYATISLLILATQVFMMRWIWEARRYRLTFNSSGINGFGYLRIRDGVVDGQHRRQRTPSAFARHVARWQDIAQIRSDLRDISVGGDEGRLESAKLLTMKWICGTVPNFSCWPFRMRNCSRNLS